MARPMWPRASTVARPRAASGAADRPSKRDKAHVRAAAGGVLDPIKDEFGNIGRTHADNEGPTIHHNSGTIVTQLVTQ